jgi:DNA-binding transcriptional ArsR family regulator
MNIDRTGAEGEDAGSCSPEVRATFARSLALGGFDDVFVLSRAEAATVLTERRRELLERLDEGEYDSVRALARAVGRDKGAVSRDLSVLAEHGLVTYEEDGRSRRPLLRHGTIVVEPVTASLSDE